MSDNKRLAFSIIQFLHEQVRSGDLSSGAQESLEGESPKDAWLYGAEPPCTLQPELLSSCVSVG